MLLNVEKESGDQNSRIVCKDGPMITEGYESNSLLSGSSYVGSITPEKKSSVIYNSKGVSVRTYSVVWKTFGKSLIQDM